jgi:hypothetical protein
LLHFPNIEISWPKLARSVPTAHYHGAIPYAKEIRCETKPSVVGRPVPGYFFQFNHRLGRRPAATMHSQRLLKAWRHVTARELKDLKFSLWAIGQSDIFVPVAHAFPHSAVPFLLVLALPFAGRIVRRDDSSPFLSSVPVFHFLYVGCCLEIRDSVGH